MAGILAGDVDLVADIDAERVGQRGAGREAHDGAAAHGAAPNSVNATACAPGRTETPSDCVKIGSNKFLSTCVGPTIYCNRL